MMRCGNYKINLKSKLAYKAGQNSNEMPNKFITLLN